MQHFAKRKHWAARSLDDTSFPHLRYNSHTALHACTLSPAVQALHFVKRCCNKCAGMRAWWAVLAWLCLASAVQHGDAGRTWVLGYGTLLNRHSRTSDAGHGAAPDRLLFVGVKDMALQWSACATEPFEFIALGLAEQPGSTARAALFAVDEDSLPLLDAREAGYNRVQISPSRLLKLPPGVQEDDRILAYLPPAASLHASAATCRGWPIAQSYLDVIVAGLLESLEGTPGEVEAEVEGYLRGIQGWDAHPFVDDRAAPRCMRPLRDSARRTRGRTLPELSPTLERRVDQLLDTVLLRSAHASSALPHPLLALRAPDVAGGWHCNQDLHADCPLAATAHIRAGH